MNTEVQRCGQRIVVIGGSGSGKTTLAKAMAEQLQIAHIELDALFWQPNWTEANREEMRSHLTRALQSDRWIIDGNYSFTRDIVWPQADTIVFLDYPFWFVFGRLLKRTLRRSLFQEELWSGNRETWQKSFLSKDSILLWMMQTHGKYHRLYPQLFQKPEYGHLSVVQLRSPQMAQQWLQSLIIDRAQRP